MSSYPKVNRTTRPKKRKFQGKLENEASTSASARKLLFSSMEDVHSDPKHCYRFIEFYTVFTAMAELVMCSSCKGLIKFEEFNNQGLGFKLVLICKCGIRNIESGPKLYNSYEVNRRIVFVMRLLGVSRDGLNLFCNLMDINQGLAQSSYDAIIKHLYIASKNVFDWCCKKAVVEEQEENKKHDRPENDLKISGDGSWRKRGFKSLYGVTTLIAYYCGKVVDLVVKSSYCSECQHWKSEMDTPEYEQWYEEHLPECSQNHHGSAGAMEVEAIKEMFLRSEEKFDVKYGNYIGDGDSKTFKGIIDIDPYGPSFPVSKSECIGHVQKRMGSHLRNIKKNFKLGGKGKLTEALITKLTTYYGLAIRRNVSSVEGMKSGIMATFFHMCSTDDEPKHQNCPSDPESWCKWQIATANGEDPKLIKHPPPLHPEVQERILPIFEDLSRDELLHRCLGGHTQNANESFSATIWRLAPKHLQSGPKIIEMAAYIATGIFNEGFSSVLRVMNQANIVVGQQCRIYVEKIDAKRIVQSNRRSLSDTKEARQERIRAQNNLNDFYEGAERGLYGPGIDD